MALRLHARAARAGDREERRREVEPGAGQGVERELRRGGEAPGRGEGAGAPQLGAEHVGQGVAEPGDQLGRRVRSVVPLVEREVADPEIGGEVDHQARLRGEDLAGHPGRFAVLQAEEHDVAAPRRPRRAWRRRSARR